MFKYILQFIIGMFFLIISTFFAWYEGSAIVDNSLEWGNSTPFTHFSNIDITNGQNISQLDYFIYAAKFQPLFPAMMIISVLYMVGIIGFYLLNRKLKSAKIYWELLGCILILFSASILIQQRLVVKLFSGLLV